MFNFRKHLIEGEAEQLLLDAMLATFKERGWLKQRQYQRSDSTHVLAKVRAINRLMCVGKVMRFALNSLAVVADDWLLQHSEEEWVHRYGHRIEEGRLPPSQADRQALADSQGSTMPLSGFTSSIKLRETQILLTANIYPSFPS